MSQRRGQFLTLVANALLAAAIVVFAVGFFPHKAVLPGLSKWEGQTAAERAAPFDKVIFMVVDALRSDFVYGNTSNFLFTQSLIRSGAAVPFTGHASPPTITMPRIKAITTGSVPSFIDLVLNFAESDTSSTLATQDSWLAQMKAKSSGRLVMYGDDTWLRLFPGFFDRADGTTSFFVSDFTEVDLNVTRHVPEELQKHDWSVMVLHYLGLDHIGHKTGPQGPNMPAKQHEMDEIVRKIYTVMDQSSHLSSALLVLLGDHGMNEGGNHGASSAGETSTALTFISPKFKTAFGGLSSPLTDVSDYVYYDEVEQSDIAPTLGALLGFPVPRNSLGIVIPKILELWTSSRDQFEILYANAQQVQRIAEATFSDTFLASSLSQCNQKSVLSNEQELACEWQEVLELRQGIESEISIQQASIAVNRFLKKAQSVLSGAASKYDLSKMVGGIGLAACATTLSLFMTWRHISHGGVAGIAFALMILLYGITMFASSYVEEEHQFWYWYTAAWLVLLVSKSRRVKESAYIGNIALCVGYGISRKWNQTGQKYAGDPDLVTEELSKRPWLLWTLILVTYAVLSRKLSSKAAGWGARQMAVLPVLVSISAFLFKLAFTSADAPELLQGIRIFDSILSFTASYPLVSLARLVFLGLGHLTITSFFYQLPWQDRQHKQEFLESFHDILTLFLITQSRTVNVPLFLIYHIQLEYLQKQNLQPLEITLTSVLLQYSSFFAAGGTNAISSVDLSNAYNGVSGYNVLAVGALTFLSNWAGPVWWMSATSCFLFKASRLESPSHSQLVSNHFSSLTLFASASTLSVMVACMVLREHLFIWTVFSPKYLYTLAWIFGQHLVVNGLIGSLILGG